MYPLFKVMATCSGYSYPLKSTRSSIKYSTAELFLHPKFPRRTRDDLSTYSLFTAKKGCLCTQNTNNVKQNDFFFGTCLLVTWQMPVTTLIVFMKVCLFPFICVVSYTLLYCTDTLPSPNCLQLCHALPSVTLGWSSESHFVQCTEGCVDVRWDHSFVDCFCAIVPVKHFVAAIVL